MTMRNLLCLILVSLGYMVSSLPAYIKHQTPTKNSRIEENDNHIKLFQGMWKRSVKSIDINYQHYEMVNKSIGKSMNI